MTTVYDIAKATGVSYSTASRILNGNANYTRPTFARRAEHVRKVAKELGYKPHAAAKATSSGRFDAVGVLIRKGHKLGSTPNPSYIRGICSALTKQGRSLIYAPISPEDFHERRSSKILHERMVDGLIIGDNNTLGPEGDAIITKQRMPVVWLNVKKEFNAVYPDDRHGGQVATEYLLQASHRRILYAGSFDPNHYSRWERIRGHQEAMANAGLDAIDPFEVPGSAGLVDRMVHMLQRPDRPTAIVTTDNIYEPLLIAATKCGLDIPGDLSIALLRHGQPMNSMHVDTFEIPAHWTGYHAANMLQRRTDDPQLADIPSEAVPYEKLIPGETVAPPRNH